MATKKKKQNVAVATWRAEALRLHLEGWNYSEIARQLGKIPSTVREGIDAELADQTNGYAEAIKQRREVKSSQLDAIIRGSMPAASDGNANAAFVVIAAIEKQMKLYGLSAAEKVDVSGALTLSMDVHQELLTRLSKLAPSEDEDALDPDQHAGKSAGETTGDGT